MDPILYDPSLGMLATLLEDIEKTRIAQGHRVRILTATEPDEDGVHRGFGLPEYDPGVMLHTTLQDSLANLEKETTKALEKAMRSHPLAAWQKQATGVGAKQLARLLGAIGDPYVNMSTGQPRTVSQLWAYCGFVPGQKRAKGQQANWSQSAKMRTYLIATSIVKTKGEYREVYDRRRVITEGSIHEMPCQICAGKGKKPEDALGKDWKLGHAHADALRYVGKRVLRDLWVASKALHEG